MTTELIKGSESNYIHSSKWISAFCLVSSLGQRTSWGFWVKNYAKFGICFVRSGQHGFQDCDCDVDFPDWPYNSRVKRYRTDLNSDSESTHSQALHGTWWNFCVSSDDSSFVFRGESLRKSIVYSKLKPEAWSRVVTRFAGVRKVGIVNYKPDRQNRLRLGKTELFAGPAERKLCIRGVEL